LKSKISDEKLEKMLRDTFNSEVPESVQFSIPENSGTVKYSGAAVSRKGRSITVKRTVKFVSVCAALAAALLPAGYAVNYFMSPDTAEEENFKEKTLFEEYMSEFEWQKNHYTYESVWKREDKGDFGAAEALSMVPDNGETGVSEVFAKVIGEGDDRIYTRQCYALWYDEEGNISAVMPSTEYYDEPDAAESVSFRCIRSVKSLAGKIESDFRDLSRPVVFEGQEIRRAFSGDIKASADTGINTVSWLIETDEGRIPAAVVNLRCVYDFEIFEEDDAVPDTSMDILRENGKTEYSTVMVYDCSGINAVRIKNTDSNTLWLKKAEREERTKE